MAYDNYGKIGILGGTFDPIHYGHLLLAEAAYDNFGLDKVLLMPTPNPYHRTDKRVSDISSRIDMVKIAIADNPHLEFSDFELKLEGPTYTVNTLTAFKEKYPETELFFIVGGDSLFSMEHWKNVEKLLETATILSSVREEQRKGASGSLKGSTAKSDYNGDGTDDRMQTDDLLDEFELQAEYLHRKYGARIHNLNLPSINISSSDIVRRIKAGQSVRYFMPDEVIGYIKDNGLYR
ncbi:MAG: nicotinate-nucleotide adenylyltransferase [Lachnospiraceae bacterium]|jgi:nicotinate-nucleotide adenylyltransferase